MGFIKDIFLRLTENTIPFGYEETLEPILNEFGLQKDSVGNYFKVIGNSDTLFTTHLDTYSKEHEKVSHIIEGDIIKTDGTTILGGDNKLGCSILLYMIQNNIPGTYYFFLGEEPILSGGLFGSKNALKQNPGLFKRFKRAIAFDRKQMGSIVVRQMARPCCSTDFGMALIEEFKGVGMEYKLDSNAYYTDTATFLDTIPECTNISAGGWNEHYKSEFVDIGYTQTLADAALKIDWESLPSIRKVNDYTINVQKFKDKLSKKTIDVIMDLMDKYDHLHTNKLAFSTGNSGELEFNHWFEDTNIKIKFETGKLMLSIDNSKFAPIQSVRELDVAISKYLGVYLDEAQNDISIEDDNIIVGEETFKIQDYINLFKKINMEKTSFKLKRGGEQYTDISGLTLYRDQFLQYLYSYL